MPPFKSASELLKRFWDFKMLQLERQCKISVGDVNKVIDVIVDYGESNGTIFAPSRIARRVSPNVTDALESYGIIQLQHEKISFCHQSYLDFLIASRVVQQVFEGESILNWLGTKDNQSLFRREQLRQALSLISEEAPDVFHKVINSIIPSGQVRFHLKHLVLEVIGQLDDESNVITQYCLELLENTYWRPHLIEAVFYGNVYWVSVLVDRGVIQAWLDSDTVGAVEDALRLLGSVINKIGDTVADILAKYVQNVDKGWPSKILDVIGWEVENDSCKIFDLRLQLLHLGFMAHILDWKRICKNSPQRALKLVESVLSTWGVTDNEKQNKRFRIDEGLYNHDMEALLEVAGQYPVDTWELLIPHVLRLTSIDVPVYDYRMERWSSDTYGSREKLGCVVIDLLIMAGRKLAAENSIALIDYAKKLEPYKTRIVDRILIKSYANLPVKLADYGVLWLLADLDRLSLGDGQVEHKWMPAFLLIEALTPQCSLELYRRLEEDITRYISSGSKKMAKNYRGESRRGLGFDFWGRMQYILLPALSSERWSESTNKLINVLARKYEKYSKERLYGLYTSTGGGGGSTLGPNLRRISNRAWLGIISNKKVPVDSNTRIWRQIDDDHILESSIWQFASSLSISAKWYPERFGRLSLEFPADTHPRYISAIIDAMMLSEPDKEFPPDIISSWEPASINTVLEVLNKFQDFGETYVALSFCRLIRNRASENWPDYVIDKVIDIALNHRDFDIKLKEDATAHDILTQTINSVRGVAIEALAKLLWNHSDLFTQYKPIIDTLVQDNDPVVALAVVGVLLPVCNLDRDKAVEWFWQVTRHDARVPASHYAVEFLNYNVQIYYERLRPIVQVMLSSEHPSVATHSAALVMAYHLFYGLFEEELDSCIEGTSYHKKGVIKNAARFIADRNYSAKCREVLARLINDEDDDVLAQISSVFRKDILALPDNLPFLLAFIQSKAFHKGIGVFMWYLKDFKNEVIPFAEVILAIGSELANARSQCAKDYNELSSSVVHELSPLLLRLYEQAQGNRPDIVTRCLDLWDILFEYQIGRTRGLTREIEC